MCLRECIDVHAKTHVRLHIFWEHGQPNKNTFGSRERFFFFFTEYKTGNEKVVKVNTIHRSVPRRREAHTNTHPKTLPTLQHHTLVHPLHQKKKNSPSTATSYSFPLCLCLDHWSRRRGQFLRASAGAVACHCDRIVRRYAQAARVIAVVVAVLFTLFLPLDIRNSGLKEEKKAGATKERPHIHTHTQIHGASTTL